MATPTSVFGNYAPAMEEPYGIESSLAKEATGGSSALAATLMDQYWLERQMRQGDYASRMADQMQFGKQQLLAQMQDQNLKHILEASKIPGALQMIASGPGYSNLTAGIDPAALQNTADWAGRTALANILHQSGTGINQLGEAGLITTPEAATGVTGLPFTQTDPRAIAVAGMREQASGAPKYTDTVKQDPTGRVIETGRNVQYRGTPPTTLPQAPGPVTPPRSNTTVTPPTTQGQDSATEAPPTTSYRQADPATVAGVDRFLKSPSARGDPRLAKALSGYINGKPHVVMDGSGGIWVIGGDGSMTPMTPTGQQ